MAGQLVLVALLIAVLVVSLRFTSSHPRWRAGLAIAGAAVSGFAVGNGSYTFAIECVVIVCGILFGGSLTASEPSRGASADRLDDPAEH